MLKVEIQYAENSKNKSLHCCLIDNGNIKQQLYTSHINLITVRNTMLRWVEEYFVKNNNLKEIDELITIEDIKCDLETNKYFELLDI